MGLKDFRSRAEPTPAPEAKTGAATTYIDSGCELAGTMRFQESVRVDGRVEGEIACQKTLVVGESGRVQARVESECVVIHGTFEGDIRARRKITLHRTARVTGDLSTAGITIEEGARFQGSIVIGAEEAPADAATATAPAVAAVAPPGEKVRAAG